MKRSISVIIIAISVMVNLTSCQNAVKSNQATASDSTAKDTLPAQVPLKDKVLTARRAGAYA